MRALAAPLFWLLLSVIVLLAIGGPHVFSPEPPPAAAPKTPKAAPKAMDLRAFLERGPACFTWNEMAGETPIEHYGGLIFVLRGEKIYSSAWYSKAKYARKWPLVSGIGAIDGESLFIAYRNAMGDPDHEFYHAACLFEFDSVTHAFHCDYMQKAEPNGPRVPGMARGTYVEHPGEEFQMYLSAILKKADSPPVIAADHPCPVLSHNQGKPEHALIYAEKEYRFCCKACMEVFQARPEVFARKEAP